MTISWSPEHQSGTSSSLIRQYPSSIINQTILYDKGLYTRIEGGCQSQMDKPRNVGQLTSSYLDLSVNSENRKIHRNSTELFDCIADLQMHYFYYRSKEKYL